MEVRSQITRLVFIALVAFWGFPLSAISQIQIGQDIDGEADFDRSGYSVSMPDANTVAIGAPSNDGNGIKAGHVRIYAWNGSAWTQKGSDIDGEAAEDGLGWSVSMPDANTVAIGAFNGDANSTDVGHVRIYEWNGSAWTKKGMDIDGESAGDKSGYSVSMPDANTVAIGAPSNDGNGIKAGHVRIYTWNGSTWTQIGVDIDGEAAGDFSGCSVSMPDAYTVAIGARLNDENGTDAGHVRIYAWNGSVWTQKGMDIDGEAAGDSSGHSVSMPDANTVAIGVPDIFGNGSDGGHVRIYEWNGSAWTKKGMDIDGESAGDKSGYSVSMPDANTVAIGAPENDGNGSKAGHVRIYAWNGSAWTQFGVDIDGKAADEFSGWSVSMPDAKTIAIGALYNDGNGFYAGYVRVYKLEGIQGLVYNDLNQNCLQEELGIAKGIKGVIQPGNIIVETGSNGKWRVDSLPIGNYNITFDTTGQWLPTCPQPITFLVTDPNGITLAPSFGMINIHPCPEPHVSIHMPFLRPGFSNQKVYVQACNDIAATGIHEDAYVDVSLDELITLNSASLSYTDLGDNTFRFTIGTLNPGVCVNFDLTTTLSTSAVLGQTLCMEAHLFPVLPCMLDTLPLPDPPDFMPCDLPWDNSSILVEVACINDSIVFTITNKGAPGSGDMDCFSPVRLYIDGQYIWLDSVLLKGGESFTFSFPGDGRTWRLEVDQHPLHPRPFFPSATIELCGDSTNWTPDLVDILPPNDDAAFIDIFCGLVRGSYDPNDKTGYPLGVGEDHIISPNIKMDYVIRFQNTGTDTAFTVVVRDTLDMDLDIFTVTSGVSSHDYNFRMHGPRVLEWTFNDILLPDSTTNEPGSNGFVTFSVHQVKDLLDGTEINNLVGIYFDFNEPVITNTTSHIVDRQLKTASWTVQKAISAEACDQYVYNGLMYTKSGSYFQIIADTLVTLNLIINKVSDVSTVLNGNTIKANNASATYQWLDCENNYTVIPGATDQTFAATADGNYAVQLIENNCVDTSACVAITTVGIIDNSFTDKFIIYPNPTTGQLFIQFDGVQDELSVSLYTLDGKLLESNITKNAAQLSYEINAPAGIYLLKISNKYQEATVRVVKE
jgi:uncharacterized repeat protein (TIGR01451 family)